MSRILSGIRPSGQLHLGNYLGAIKQWIDLQDQHEVFYMVADLHAITTPYEPKELPQMVRQTVIDYLAAGLDPKKSTIFVQSHVPAHSQLSWLFGTLVPFGDLSRMTQWKEKSGKSDEDAAKFIFSRLSEKLEAEPDYVQKMRAWHRASKRAMDGESSRESLSEILYPHEAIKQYGQSLIRELELYMLKQVNAGVLYYPVLMAADILAYKPEAVPVGEDQDQHVELSRVLAKKFNHLFGQTFPEPKSLHTPGKRIMDLGDPEKKMSKSLDGGIGLNDSPAEIEKKLKKAVSSSEPRVIREGMKAAAAGEKAVEREWKGDQNLQKQFHGVRNLFTILRALGNEAQIAEWESQAERGELKFSEFKPALASIIAEHFAPFRQRRAELEKDTKFVDQVIAQGNKKACAVAEKTLRQVQERMGLR